MAELGRNSPATDGTDSNPDGVVVVSKHKAPASGPLGLGRFWLTALGGSGARSQKARMVMFSAQTGVGTVGAGQRLPLDIWVNAPNASQLRMGCEYHDAAGAFINSDQFSIIGVGAYKKYSAVMTTPPGTSQVLVFVYTDGVIQAITFYLDDVSLGGGLLTRFRNMLRQRRR